MKDSLYETLILRMGKYVLHVFPNYHIMQYDLNTPMIILSTIFEILFMVTFQAEDYNTFASQPTCPRCGMYRSGGNGMARLVFFLAKIGIRGVSTLFRQLRTEAERSQTVAAIAH